MASLTLNPRVMEMSFVAKHVMSNGFVAWRFSCAKSNVAAIAPLKTLGKL